MGIRREATVKGRPATGGRATSPSRSAAARIAIAAVLVSLAIAAIAPSAEAANAVTVSVGCSPATVHINQATTCTATVADAARGPVPTGSVDFANAATPPQRDFCFLTDGACSIQYTPATAGDAANHLTATYKPDAAHMAGSASTVVAVTPHGTSLSVSCAPSSVITGLPTICTGTVTNTDPDAGTFDGPKGKLTFTGAGFNDQSCPTDTDFHGGATCQVQIRLTLPGANVITAKFNGNVNFAEASGSTTVTAKGPAKSGGGGSAQNVLLACAKRSVRLFAAVPSGAHQTQIDGIALASYAGRSVAIKSGKRVIGHATIGTDGSFETKVARAGGVYVASVNGRRSRPLGLSRHLILASPTVDSGSVKISGRLIDRKVARRQVTVTRLTDCTLTKRAGLGRTDAQGHFAVTVKAPSATDGTVAYRVRVISGESAYTLPVLVHG
jgi:hypothetical protein